MTKSVPIPPDVRVEEWPASLPTPADCETAVRQGNVIYASKVQILRLAMGESIAVIDLNTFADVFNGPLPPMRPTT